MKWTTEKPTKKGWYWYRASRVTTPVIAQVDPSAVGSSAMDYVWWNGDDVPSVLSEVSGEWHPVAVPVD